MIVLASQNYRPNPEAFARSEEEQSILAGKQGIQSKHEDVIVFPEKDMTCSRVSVIHRNGFSLHAACDCDASAEKYPLLCNQLYLEQTWLFCSTRKPLSLILSRRSMLNCCVVNARNRK